MARSNGLRLLVLGSVSAGLLAACGVEGPPLRPSLDAGVSVSQGGIHPSVGVGVRQGPVSIRVGL